MSSWDNTEKILLKEINFKNKLLLDIGCGSGWLSIWSFTQGAKEIYGIDPLKEQIYIAKSNCKIKNINFALGFAERLSFKDNKFDLIFFFNSLHHIPIKLMNKALEESRRTIKDAGIICVVEPLSEGTFNQMLKIVDDEKNIRKHAYESIKELCSNKLVYNKEIYYEEKKKFKNFSEFCDLILSADPTRKKNIDKYKKNLRLNYNRLSTLINNKHEFIQPMRMNIIKFNNKE